MPAKKVIDGDREHELVALYTQRGLGTEELARHFGCSRSAIDGALRRAGVELRTREQQQRLNMIQTYGSLSDRVKGMVREDKESGCWVYTGKPAVNGRAHVTVLQQQWWLHRLAWFAWFGPIPDEAIVVQACGNPLCANPAHLRLGTREEAMREAVERGAFAYDMRRILSVSGDRAPRRKLDSETVKNIRQRLACEEATASTIAAEIGVDVSTIRAIRRGDTWKSPGALLSVIPNW